MELIEVEYKCDGCCGMTFVVHHRDNNRNTHCFYCGTPVQLTGVVRKIEGDDLVEYTNGVETYRRIAPGKKEKLIT